MQSLLTWLGNKDVENAITGKDAAVSSALAELQFDRVYIFYNFSSINFNEYIDNLIEVRKNYNERVNFLKQNRDNEFEDYSGWLKTKTNCELHFKNISLNSPTYHSEIYQNLVHELETIKKANPDSDFVFHLSPGTPAMHAVWIILSQTKFPAELIESSPESGVKKVELPFEITADYIPDLEKYLQIQTRKYNLDELLRDQDFEGVYFQSDQMVDVFNKCINAADKDISVLILGESGTGKEIAAELIKKKSLRSNKVFRKINCGAIPKELVESELFGHVKGAFTGAEKDKEGLFSICNGGTLFLDEIGDLPLSAQVKLLRVLNDGTFTPVGSTKEFKSDVRIISATKVDLFDAVRRGQFREDLFYRLAVGVIHIPPLREREGDLSLLIDKLMEKLNDKYSTDGRRKSLTVSARKELLRHPWYGNIRELYNTLERVYIFSAEEEISGQHATENLLNVSVENKEILMKDHVPENFSFEKYFKVLVDHYYNLAAQKTSKKTEIAKLLGFKNYQTMDNWMEKFK